MTLVKLRLLGEFPQENNNNALPPPQATPLGKLAIDPSNALPSKLKKNALSLHKRLHWESLPMTVGPQTALQVSCPTLGTLRTVPQFEQGPLCFGYVSSGGWLLRNV